MHTLESWGASFSPPVSAVGLTGQNRTAPQKALRHFHGIHEDDPNLFPVRIYVMVFRPQRATSYRKGTSPGWWVGRAGIGECHGGKSSNHSDPIIPSYIKLQLTWYKL